MHPDFKVACDMLTRTSRIDDIAPDVSIYPRALHPVTRGRQLEHVSFQIANTETLTNAAKKAEKLVGRGVRRVFLIDARRLRVHEWARELGTWSVLAPDFCIVDPVFTVPLHRGDRAVRVTRLRDGCE